MQYPLMSEYVSAIQDASENLDELAHLVPVLDDHGEPYRSSGAFAVVFKMKDEQTGKCYALKCFLEEQEGRAEAYRLIADELDCVDSSYVTSVKYLDKEIFVDSSCEEDEFPVLLMDWVEGETMETYIANNYQDEYAMGMLCYRFCKMAAWLRSQPFAHGDIKPDNIIVRPDGTLALVDYDGMFVPAMKGQKSPTIGTKDFSHPLRTVDDFDETIDDFALASIALSLKAISLKPSLLNEYGAADRLLFSADDYRDLSKSKVFGALRELMNDEEFTTLLSMFLLVNTKKNLAMCSFRLFVGKEPKNVIEILSTKVEKDDLANAVMDKYWIKYSLDGKRLLKATDIFIETYSIKGGTKVICDFAFGSCVRISKIVVPNSVASIGDGAFSNCSSLTSIVIPGSVTSIGDGAFSNCHSLTDIVIPKSVTSIGDGVFSGCSSLTGIVIPGSVTSIGDGAFSNCHSLMNIVIPKSVTSIGDGVFSGCGSLTSIVIPDSVTKIDGNPFSGWHGKLKVLSSLFNYDNGVLFDNRMKRIIAFVSYAASYDIPDSVTCIGNNAFKGCSSLSSIVIPDSVTSISDGAFSGCSSLVNIVIPDSVTSIENNVFKGCGSLSSIVIPDSVTSIGDGAFSGCSSLVSIVIPKSVTSIANNAFKRCRSLSSIVIPDSVTSIGDGVFSGCSSLVSIVIPDSVISIGNNAFEECCSLSGVFIPDSVTYIGNGAFSHCDLLRSVIIPNTVTRIGDYAFVGCIFLDNVFIPDSVMNIGEYAFAGCTALYNVEIPDRVVNIAEGAFYQCCLSSIIVPTSVTSVGKGAFWGCDFLPSIREKLISRFGKEVFEDVSY